MKSKLMRTVIVTSLLAGLMGSALAIYGPTVVHRLSGNNDATLQPAIYTGPEASASDNATPAPARQQPVLRTRPRAARTSASPSYDSAPSYSSAPSDPYYGEPAPARHDRPFNQSAMIVAGSAGTGAAIGAIAGGGKGAAIGALSGGVAGFIYDRVTAHK
jgi:hypothetical protein